MPTVINNVETYCAAARIIENGPGWFTSMGTQGSAGTKVFSVSGDCGQPGVYELPFGITVGDLLARVGATDTIAVQVGGAAGRMIGPAEFGRKFCYDDLATGGSVMVFGPQRDVLGVAHAFMEFFVDESCGYCTPCRVGTRLLLERLRQFLAGNADRADIDYLEKTGKAMKTAESVRPWAVRGESGAVHHSEFPSRIRTQTKSKRRGVPFVVRSAQGGCHGGRHRRSRVDAFGTQKGEVQS